MSRGSPRRRSAPEGSSAQLSRAPRAAHLRGAGALRAVRRKGVPVARRVAKLGHCGVRRRRERGDGAHSSRGVRVGRFLRFVSLFAPSNVPQGGSRAAAFLEPGGCVRHARGGQRPHKIPPMRGALGQPALGRRLGRSGTARAVVRTLQACGPTCAALARAPAALCTLRRGDMLRDAMWPARLGLSQAQGEGVSAN